MGNIKILILFYGNNDNIKITTPEDYYIAEALIKQRKNKEVWGL